MTATPLLIASLLYGSGMRLRECITLRVKDVDFEGNLITIKQGKHNKDRDVMLPLNIKECLSLHIAKVKDLHEADLKKGFGSAPLPHALDRKYPDASTSWKWQYLFPSATISPDRQSGVMRRHHIHESTVQRAVNAEETICPGQIAHCAASEIIEIHAFPRRAQAPGGPL